MDESPAPCLLQAHSLAGSPKFLLIGKVKALHSAPDQPRVFPWPGHSQAPASVFRAGAPQPTLSLSVPCPLPSSPLKRTSVSQLPTAWIQSPGFGVYYITLCPLLSN